VVYPMPPSMSRRWVPIYMTIYALSASSNYFFVKFGLDYSSPLVYMSVRYLLAGVVLIMISMIINGNYHIIFNRDVVLLSLFSSIATALWAYGLVYIDPGSSAIFGYTMPLFAIPLSILLFNEKPSKASILGTALGLIGVLIYGLSAVSRGVSLLGSVITVVNALFWALYSIYFRKLSNYNGLIVVSSMFIFGSVVMAIAALAMYMYGDRLALSVDWGFNFMDYLMGTSVIGGSVLFLVWYLMVNSVGVANVTAYIFTVPALTLILNYIIMGIRPTINEVIGALIMFIGIYLASAGTVKGHGA